MPQYVILADHTPDICPSSNKRSRACAIDGMGQQLQTLAADAGITFTTPLLHLDPSHRMVAVVDAPSIERSPTLAYADRPDPVEHRRGLPGDAGRRLHGRPGRLPDRLRLAAGQATCSSARPISTLPETLRTLRSTRASRTPPRPSGPSCSGMSECTCPTPSRRRRGARRP